MMQDTSDARFLKQITIVHLPRYYSLLLLGSALLAAFFLAGCASAPEPPHDPPPTAPMPAGHPEVTIQGKSPQQIAGEARRLFLARGYQELSTEHPSKLAFDRPEANVTEGRFPDNALRVRLTLQPLPKGAIRLSGYSYRVQKWKEAQEEENAISYALPQIQVLLNQLKANLDAAR